MLMLHSLVRAPTKVWGMQPRGEAGVAEAFGSPHSG